MLFPLILSAWSELHANAAAFTEETQVSDICPVMFSVVGTLRSTLTRPGDEGGPAALPPVCVGHNAPFIDGV